MSIQGKEVINGTWGKVLLNGVEVAEVIEFQAKINFKFADINSVGELATDKKIIGYDGTGTLRMHKINSRMISTVGGALTNGRDVRWTITSQLADPDSKGIETIVVKNVLFSDLTLADFASAKAGEVQAPFNFTKYEIKDTIPV